jgi:hypothetical protein
MTYDEALFVAAGSLRVESVDDAIDLRTGDVGLIQSGTTAVYRGSAGTEVSYAVTPRDWERDAGVLDLER